MASLYNADLKPIGPDVKTRPYDHATRLFVADNLRLAPKQTFLYYVVLNVNQSVLAGLASMAGANTGAISSQSLFEQYEAGLMVKRIDLPKFSISNKTYNAYNRKNIITNAISYDPISVTFHDDAADIVTKFWNDYYTYYYRDSDYNAELYSVPHKYQDRLRSKWGFTPMNRQLISFLRDVQIFSLHNKRFTEYRLLNPIITSWRHGVHDSSPNNETMTNSMTLAYETVKYRTGTVNPVDVNGFSILHYDTTPSPISTSTTNIYSNAGVLGAIGTAGSQDLARPDGQGSGRGVFGDILSAYNLYKNVKNVDFRSAAQLTIGQWGAGAINGAINGTLNGQIFPTAIGSPGYGNGASSMVGTNVTTGVSPYANPLSVSVGGAVTTLATGAAVTVGGAAMSGRQQAVAEAERGSETLTQTGSPFGQTAAFVGGGVFGIPFNPYSGQPNVGNNQLLTLQNGTFVPTSFSLTSNGFNPNNVELNMAKAPIEFKDQSGSTVVVRSYADGSSIAFDSGNNPLYTIPAGAQNYTPQELSQITANAQRQLNIDPSTGTRFVTNPSTGVTTAVGGTTAVISNTLSQTVGAVGGVIAGKRVYESLARTGLGKTMLGQVVAGGLSAATTASVYKITNNLLQPFVVKGVGAIGQAFDEVSKSVRNIGGTLMGSGGAIPMQPFENIRSTEYEPGGGVLTTYQNGEQLYEDAAGNITRTLADENIQAPALIVDSNFNSVDTNDDIFRAYEDLNSWGVGFGETDGLI